MFNGIIDSREVRAQKAAKSSQSSGSSSSSLRRSEEQLEIRRLKETLKQRDDYYTSYLAQQHAMLQVT